MQPDPIVEEVRRAREAYARRFNFDLQMICRDLREQEKASGRESVTLPPRRPEPNQAVAARFEPACQSDAADNATSTKG